MTRLVICILLTAAASCQYPNNDGRQVERFRHFDIAVPGEWKMYEQGGIDSDVGYITNGKDTLNFDYGWHSRQPSLEHPEGKTFSLENIGGLQAIITRPPAYRQGELSMFVKVDKKNRFGIYGNDITDTGAVLDIFRSIRFTEKDHMANEQWVTVNYSIDGKGGRQLFYEHCGGCHSLHLTGTGPAIKYRLHERGENWMQKYLRQTLPSKKDSIARALKKEFYPMECRLPEKLDSAEIQRLMKYITFNMP